MESATPIVCSEASIPVTFAPSSLKASAKIPPPQPTSNIFPCKGVRSFIKPTLNGFI